MRWSPPSDGLLNAAVYYPRCWRKYSAIKPSSPYPYPPAQFSPNPFNPPPAVFLHERHTPSGRSRLVVVFGESANASDLGGSAEYIVLTPPSLLGPAPAREVRPILYFSRPYVPIALHPGVPDPNDLTHFTIPFDIVADDGGTPLRSGCLDGYLKDNDTIAFRIRDPATTQPPFPPADPAGLRDYNLLPQ